MTDPNLARLETPAAVSAEVIAHAVARCFQGRHGAVAMAHLRRLYSDRRLPPTAGDAELWHLEGQRSVVSQLELLIRRGRIGPSLPTTAENAPMSGSQR